MHDALLRTAIKIRNLNKYKTSTTSTLPHSLLFRLCISTIKVHLNTRVCCLSSLLLFIINLARQEGDDDQRNIPIVNCHAMSICISFGEEQRAILNRHIP